MSTARKTPNSIFISHRHIDHRIADAFREAIDSWSDGAVNVYQSSHAASASRISEDLDEAIAEAIADCNMVLLIYTQAPGDMDWCMFECGLAQDPRSDNTRVAVFHTTESPPDPLDGLISMRLDQDSVFRFVFGFHRDPDFMPGLKKPLFGNVSDEDLQERTADLFQRLKQEAPERPTEVTVYDRLSLGLSYNKAEELRKLGEKESLSDVYQHACKILPEALKVRSCSGEPEAHFNFSDVNQANCFGDMTRRWRMDSAYSEGNFWEEGVYEAITRAILQRPEREVAFPFNSLTSDDGNWLLPILARHRTIPFERIVEFDLLFCRLNTETAKKMLSI